MSWSLNLVKSHDPRDPRWIQIGAFIAARLLPTGVDLVWKWHDAISTQRTVDDLKRERRALVDREKDVLADFEKKRQNILKESLKQRKYYDGMEKHGRAEYRRCQKALKRRGRLDAEQVSELLDGVRRYEDFVAERHEWLGRIEAHKNNALEDLRTLREQRIREFNGLFENLDQEIVRKRARITEYLDLMNYELKWFDDYKRRYPESVPPHLRITLKR